MVRLKLAAARLVQPGGAEVHLTQHVAHPAIAQDDTKRSRAHNAAHPNVWPCEDLDVVTLGRTSLEVGKVAPDGREDFGREESERRLL